MLCISQPVVCQINLCGPRVLICKMKRLDWMPFRCLGYSLPFGDSVPLMPAVCAVDFFTHVAVECVFAYGLPLSFPGNKVKKLDSRRRF